MTAWADVGGPRTSSKLGYQASKFPYPACFTFCFLTAGATGISGAASAAGVAAAFFGMLLKYLPTPEPFAVDISLPVPAGLLNHLPTPSSSVSRGPASFAACTDQSISSPLKKKRKRKAVWQSSSCLGHILCLCVSTQLI